uniref:Carboxylic ester hydrolase n=1 Tax=Ditylenchus dipsaci TaxID=166011 RepID=A0A915EDC9_9BILA
MGSASSSSLTSKHPDQHRPPLTRHFRSNIPSPIVATRNGPLEGKRLKLKAKGPQQEDRWVNVFLGIPYAKPPLGELRFKKPVALDEPAWRQPLSTKRYKSRSIQRDFFWDTMELRVGKSEDCLYLNVITPAWSPDCKLFPDGFGVMVYIHGGGFVMDSAVKYNYACVSRTLVRHDVIVVTIQYRLGFLGYFFTGDENATGNYGLYDQMMALKWVKENIANFGGNPNNITVFGQSAGAVSADLLSLSPLSRDLFQNIILMGGSAESMWALSSREQLMEYCQQKALKLGFQRSSITEQWTKEENADLMQFLRAVPAEKFEATMIGDRIVIGELRIPITPIIDGEILPKSIKELRKESPKRNVMAGVCKYEGLLFLALGFQRANAKFLIYCERRAQELLDEANRRSSIPSEAVTLAAFRDLYGISDHMRKDKKAVQQVSVAIMSDLINNLPLQNYCDKMTQLTNSTSCFEPLLPFVGATHCTELMRNHTDRKVLDLTTRMWTNFAKFGNPNGVTQAGIQKYDNNNNNFDVKEFNAEPTDIQFRWEPVNNSQPENHLVIREKPQMRQKLETRRIERLAPPMDSFLQ